MENKEIVENAIEEELPKDKQQKILFVEGDLGDMRLSSRDVKLILDKLNQLHLEGKIQTIEEAREIAPTIDIKELRGENEEKQKPPRHTKKKGERY